MCIRDSRYINTLPDYRPRVDFENTRGVIGQVIFDMDASKLSEVKSLMKKFAKWQQVSRQENIRNVEKSLGQILFKFDTPNTPSSTLVRFKYKIDGKGSAQLYVTQLSGGCDSHSNDVSVCRNTQRRGGYVSPEDARNIIKLIDGIGSARSQKSKADLLK